MCTLSLIVIALMSGQGGELGWQGVGVGSGMRPLAPPQSPKSVPSPSLDKRNGAELSLAPASVDPWSLMEPSGGCYRMTSEHN
jgi:hypothetical protein